MSAVSPTDTSALAAPPARPTLARTFWAMMAREVRVMRKNFVSTFTRVIAQPLLFVFVFAYVLPKIGTGGAMFAQQGGGPTFSTILVPGMVASSIVMQGIMAAIFPLMMELTWQRSITDRALAPVPVPLLGVQKIIAAATQAFVAGLLVFPAVLFIHAEGQGPSVHIDNWPLFLLMMVTGSLLSGAGGLLLGTLIDPQKSQVLFTVVLLPMTMLGCVYYPWAAMDGIRWLQIATLANPMVYLSEGLRAALTPQVEHMPFWAYGSVLVLGTAVVVWWATRTFTKRVLT
ncbi:ABC transporter permease [Actinomadura kijaniata]|uniref:Transport permease protein n=1 Tax=Actinomadura namibiensis TaxID=182080 RepID=A0A7W3LXQ5_ACTNM|nr:ABC transporter permease [Actinomadura namibiensis]MBA8956253.1 ABC-2 type transport system permease protein [Actinomadura namibiensis]